MKKKKISVIISVYNTANYIKKCLDSILNQTYKNLEIILIEDGSTDNSVEILKKYEKKDSRIVLIINEKNMGLAASRNKGLARATGDYIGFIDSDDYIPLNYYETLIKAIEKEHADVAICDINLMSEAGNTLTKCGTKDNKIINVINNGLAASACNKLFKKDLFLNLEYPENIINEDVAVILPIIANSKKIKYTDETYYNYIQREKSIQNSSISEKRFDIFKTVELAFKKIKKLEYKECIIFNQIILLLLFVIPKESKFVKRYKFLNKYSKLCKKYNIAQNKYYLEFLENQGLKHKIYYQILIKSIQKRFILIANMLIAFYHFYNKHFVKEVIKANISKQDLINTAKKNQTKKSKYKISVVIPNYNYSHYLFERLYSILNQTTKIFEIIILDDCSTDHSQELIMKLEKIISPIIPFKVVLNEKNSGSAFKQWQKGFELATGDYVWIAEADDYCDSKLLYYLQKNLTKNIIISYADTSFMDAQGKIYLKSIVKEIDIQKTGHYSKSFVSDGKEELNKYAFLNTTIANVSSCIIKNGTYPFFKGASAFKQAGDWYIYANLMLLGDVKYTHKQLNYYRVHGNNVTSTTKKQAHLKEIQKMHSYLDQKIKFTKEQKNLTKKRIAFLKKVWDLD